MADRQGYILVTVHVHPRAIVLSPNLRYSNSSLNYENLIKFGDDSIKNIMTAMISW